MAMSTSSGPREIRCPECGHWVHRRPGDAYGCPCGCFTRFAASEAEVEAIVAQVRAEDHEREVVVDYCET